MKILLIAATRMEIEPFFKLNPGIEILICGIGIPTTVYHLTKKLLAHPYDIVIQAGIAGSFNDKINLGEVVLVKQDTFADIGAEEKGNFKTIFKMGLEDENNYPYENGWLKNDHSILKKSSLKITKAITINKINDLQEERNKLVKIFNADVESMEGAAFHYVCLQQKISFIQIRSISNQVGERDKSKWKIREAIGNLNIEIKNLIDLINK